MRIVANECRTETTEDDVNRDPDGKQEAGSYDAHSG